jgi:tetratricopeptide (TPR) repeat protein
VHRNLGQVLLEQHDLDEAAACYRTILSLQPSDIDARIQLARVLIEQRKRGEAETCLREAIALDTDNAMAPNVLGAMLQVQGDLDQAVSCYQLAIARNPGFLEAHSNLGAAFIEQGKLDDAEIWLQKARALNPDCALTHKNLGALYQVRGNHGKALDCYRRALELDPTDDCTRMNLVYHALHACEWSDLDSNCVALRAAVQNASAPAGDPMSPFAFLALPGTTAQEQRICAEKWAQNRYGSLVADDETSPSKFTRDADKPITSATFRRICAIMPWPT